jgi:hypothetical protein
MNLKKNIFVILIVLLGCSATGPKFKKPENFNNQYSQLFIYRPSSGASAIRTSEFFINKKFAAKLNNNGYTLIAIEPGNYEISQKWVRWPGDPKRNLETLSNNIMVEPGKNYYLRFFQTSKLDSLVTATFTDHFQIINEEQALQEIKECRFQDPESAFEKNLTKKLTRPAN